MSTLINLILKRNVVQRSINNLSCFHRCNLLRNSNAHLVRSHHLYSTKFHKVIRHSELLKLNNELINCRSIRTTNPNRLPPIFWLALRPVLNVVALLGKSLCEYSSMIYYKPNLETRTHLGGRRMRVWWRNLSEERKEHYRRLLIRNKRLVYGLVGGLLILATIYYQAHIEESPVTKRKRFVAVSKEKFNELADIQFEMQLKMFEDKLLPNWHPKSRLVERVATRVIKANLDINEFREKKWTTAVVEAPHIKNAMVVGDGRIFVFTGKLPVCSLTK